MLCEKCHQREATVHRQVVINGVGHSEHLCAQCAAKEGRMPMFGGFGAFSQGDLLGQMLAQWFGSFAEPLTSRDTAPETSTMAPCPECGMSWEAFQNNGFLGCSTCYEHFKDELPPFMRNLHRAEGGEEDVQHQAQATKAKESGKVMSAKEHLEAELARAIEEERFEEACALRDAIKAFEAQKHSGEND